MARINKQDSVETPNAHPQRSDDDDTEGHARVARASGAEIEQVREARVANKPSDDEDVEGHAVRMRQPEDESVRNRIN